VVTDKPALSRSWSMRLATGPYDLQLRSRDMTAVSLNLDGPQPAPSAARQIARLPEAARFLLPCTPLFTSHQMDSVPFVHKVSAFSREGARGANDSPGDPQFPVGSVGYPVNSTIFPVSASRELCKKWLQSSVFYASITPPRLQNPGNPCKTPC
jgi:hypothetical protein